MLGLWQTVPVTHWPLQPQQDPQDKVLTKSVLSTLRRYATPRLDWSFIWELMTLQSRCSVCGKQCLSRIGLSSHSKTHKIKSSPKVFCPHCEKVCNSKIGLWNHLRTHDSKEQMLSLWQTVPVTHWPLQPQQDPQDKVLTKSVLSTLWEGMQLQDWTVKSSENSRLNRAHSRCVCGKTVPVTRIGLFIHSKSHKTKSSPKVFCPHWEGMQLQNWNGESSIC